MHWGTYFTLKRKADDAEDRSWPRWIPAGPQATQRKSETMKQIDLKRLHVGQVDESEFQHLLLTQFGRSQYISKDTQRFHKDNSDRVLDLKYNNKHKIISCVTNLNKQEIDILESKIVDDLIENQHESIGQVVCFSHDKIAGFFRYKDVFQIMPAGHDFADIPYALGDHPFILQSRYTKGPNSFINHLRRAAASTAIIRSLAVVTKSAVFMPSRNARFFWVIEPQGEQTVSKWVQGGYAPPTGFAVDLDHYSETAGLQPIKLVASNDYYGQGFFRTAQGFALPANIESVLDGIFALSEDTLNKFRIAATWLSMAGDISAASSSAGYISIVASLESLLEKSSETCPECDQPKFSVTKRLKRFLTKYVPGLDQYPKELAMIYRTRSDLAHGLNMLLTDLEHFDWAGTDKKQSEMTLRIRTVQIARVAVLNWVLEAIDSSGNSESRVIGCI
jgi:hypothetical protein